MVSVFKSIISSVNPIAVRTPISILEYIKINSSIETLKRDNPYEYVKKNQYCVTWAGVFDTRYLSSDCKLSGLMYFDVDHMEEGLEENLDYIKSVPYTYSCWKSFSGKGIGFLVRVKDLTFNNFKSTYSSICEEYGLPIDNLPDRTRLNVISYDPNIYINENSDLFQAREPDVNNTELIARKNNNKLLDKMLQSCYNITKRNYSFNIGSRNNFTFNFFITCLKYGIDKDVANWWLNSNGLVYDETFSISNRVYSKYITQFNTWNWS